MAVVVLSCSGESSLFKVLIQGWITKVDCLVIHLSQVAWVMGLEL